MTEEERAEVCSCPPGGLICEGDEHTFRCSQIAATIEVLIAKGKAEVLYRAAEAVSAALVNEIGSGHTTTYSVRRWLQELAATQQVPTTSGESR